jgi:hypothetical protein
MRYAESCLPYSTTNDNDLGSRASRPDPRLLFGVRPTLRTPQQRSLSHHTTTDSGPGCGQAGNPTVKRRCIENECGELTERTRCPTHQQALAHQRGYTTEYKVAHQRARRALAPQVAAGTTCTRCGLPLHPTQPWDADQRPWGWEPAHSNCNRSAGARGIA